MNKNGKAGAVYSGRLSVSQKISTRKCPELQNVPRVAKKWATRVFSCTGKYDVIQNDDVIRDRQGYQQIVHLPLQQPVEVASWDSFFGPKSAFFFSAIRRIKS